MEKPALGHDVVSCEEKAPTCTETGWDAYEACARCDYTTKVEKPALGHDCGEVTFLWNAFYTEAKVSGSCSRCDAESFEEDCKIDMAVEYGKLVITATAELTDGVKSETKIIQVMENGDGTYTLEMPEGIDGLMLLIAGYDSDGRLVDIQMEDADAEIEISVKATEIKLFFCADGTYAPVLPCLWVK